MAAKSSFCFPSILLPRHWIKIKPRHVQRPWPPLSAKGSFVRIDPAVWMLSADNPNGNFKLYIKIKILHGKNWTGSIFWAHLILREIAFGKAVIWLDGCKKLFLFFFNTNTSRHRIKLEPRYVEAQGPILSFKVPFVKIGVAVWTLPGYNHFWQS